MLKIHGKQGHIAYPHLADNPTHRSLAGLKALCDTQWDRGIDNFPPSSFQISNLNAGTGVGNIIPNNLTALFNFRFSPASTPTELQQKVQEILDQHQLCYNLNWQLSGEPFFTGRGKLLEATCAAITQITGVTPQLSTAGGTSDGRFIAPSGSEVIELGPGNGFHPSD